MILQFPRLRRDTPIVDENGYPTDTFLIWWRELAKALETAYDGAQDNTISTSWTSPGLILTASDAGSSVSITIADHLRYYDDSTNVSVAGGTLVGLNYSTTYYIYYVDDNMLGGEVVYVADTNPNNALPNAATGVHFCGKIATPAALGANTTGGVYPPGGGGSVVASDVP